MDYCRPSDAHTLPIASTSSFPVLLTTSVVLLAVDATMHILRWRSRDHASTSINAPPPQPMTRFVTETRRILADVQTLEKQLANEHDYHQKIHMQSERHKVNRTQHLITRTETTRQGHVACIVESHRGDRMSSEFAAFCERLLLVNQIWKQEKQLKAQQEALEARAQASGATAFNTFCDQLLLWNRIWKLEREVTALVADGERLKRGRVTAVTRAAKRMVLDVQKERMVEEFVKDLIEDVAASKREVDDLREEHTKEIEEVHGDWIKDYRRVARELETLKLAQEARLAEQEVSNTMEESLCESLRAGKRRVEALEEKIAEYGRDGYTSSNGVPANYSDDEATDVELDNLSELSSSSTCVSSGGSIRRSTRRMSDTAGPHMQRRRCTSHGASLRDAPFKGSLLFSSTSPQDGTAATATRTYNHSGKPLAIRNRTTSVLSRPPMSKYSSNESESKGAQLSIKARAPWRF